MCLVANCLDADATGAHIIRLPSKLAALWCLAVYVENADLHRESDIEIGRSPMTRRTHNPLPMLVCRGARGKVERVENEGPCRLLVGCSPRPLAVAG